MKKKPHVEQQALSPARVFTIEVDHEPHTLMELRQSFDQVPEKQVEKWVLYFDEMHQKRLQKLRAQGCPEDLIAGVRAHVIKAWYCSVARSSFALEASSMNVRFWKSAKRALDVRAYIQEKPMVFLGIWAGSALVLGQLAALAVVVGAYALFKISPVWIHPRLVLHASNVHTDWALQQLGGQDHREVYRVTPAQWKEAGKWLKEQSEEGLKPFQEILDTVSWFDLMEAEDAKWQQIQEQYEACLVEGFDPLTPQEKDWVYAFGFYKGVVDKIEQGHADLSWRKAKKNVSEGVEKVVENLTKMVLRGKNWLNGL